MEISRTRNIINAVNGPSVGSGAFLGLGGDFVLASMAVPELSFCFACLAALSVIVGVLQIPGAYRRYDIKTNIYKDYLRRLEHK